MSRYYKSGHAARTEQERRLGVKTSRREQPDLEAIARLIVDFARDDILGLAQHQRNKAE